jgi:putative methionine-R-sulfoxide reductase with GAF domain
VTSSGGFVEKFAERSAIGQPQATPVTFDGMKQETLARLTWLADHGGDHRAVWQEAAELIRRSGDYRWVGLYEVTDTEIGAIVWTGTAAPAFPRFPRDKGLNGVAVKTKDAVVSQDVANDPRYLTAFATTGSEAIFPVLGDPGSVIGTIDVECDRLHAFSPQDEHFLRACAMALRRLWRSLPQDTPPSPSPGRS